MTEIAAHFLIVSYISKLIFERVRLLFQKSLCLIFHISMSYCTSISNFGYPFQFISAVIHRTKIFDLKAIKIIKNCPLSI